MLISGLPPPLWSVLDGQLWHATECDSLVRIISDGEIKPDVGDRYKISFCRSQDSVCLFDFGPTSCNHQSQFPNWSGWLGCQQKSRIAIWLKIDRAGSNKSLLDAGAAKTRWNRIRNTGGFIPGVEACHKGSISLDAVLGALLIARDDTSMFQQCDELREIFQQIAAFKLMLPPSPQNSVIERLSRNPDRHRRQD